MIWGWLTLAALIAPPGEVGVEQWARELYAKAAPAAAFTALRTSLEAAATAIELGGALPPLSFSAGVDHGQSAADYGDWQRATTNTFTRGTSYLPFGGTFSGSLVLGWSALTRAERSVTPGADLSLSVDVLRDAGGRLTRAQRRAAMASGEAELHAARAAREDAIAGMLALALDGCVQDDLRRRTAEILSLLRASLASAEQRAKVGLMRESEVLQIRGQVLATERSLTELTANRDALLAGFRATFGVEVDLSACPAVTIEPTKTQEVLRAADDVDAAPRKESADASVRQSESAVESSRLELWPTLSPFASVRGAGLFRRPDGLFTPLISDAEAWTSVVGAQMTWELGDSPGELAEQLARINLSTAKARAEQTRLEVRAELLQLAVQMRGLEAAMAIVEAQGKTAREVLRLHRTRFEVGTLSAFELSGAYQALLQSETATPGLEAQWLTRYWRALALVGKLHDAVGGP